KENLSLGDTASRTWCDSLVTSRKVTHATTAPGFGKWLIRAIQSLKRGISHSGRVAISLWVSSSGGGLFKRPVILWIRGAFYLRRSSKIPKYAGITFPGRPRTALLLHSYPTTSCGRRRPE